MSRFPDIAVGLAALLIAGIYATFASDIPHSFLSDPVGASGLPNLYAIVLALLAAVLIGRTLSANPGNRVAGPRHADRSSWSRHLRAVGLLLPGIIYLLVIASAGYFAAIFLLMAGVALYAGAQPGVRLLAISLVGAVAMWMIFDKLFQIPLPAGSLWSQLFG